MTLAGLEHLAVVLVAVTFLGALGALAGVVIHLRRRWRRRRSLFVAVRGRLEHIPLARLTDEVVSTVASPSWWLVQRDRHTMWRAVATARRAVSVAARAGAPVGELPMISRQLQQAARGVDAALRASGADRHLARDVATDCARIEQAAADIRAAAVASLVSTRADVQPVLSAIAVEITALAAGVQSARSMRWSAR
jgi:hypothetical protein